MLNNQYSFLARLLHYIIDIRQKKLHFLPRCTIKILKKLYGQILMCLTIVLNVRNWNTIGKQDVNYKYILHIVENAGNCFNTMIY